MLPLLSQCTKRVLGQGRFSFSCPAAEPRHPPAHDRSGTGRRVLRRAGAAGAGRHHGLHRQLYHDGQMTDSVPTDADLQKGFDGIPKFPGNEI